MKKHTIIIRSLLFIIFSSLFVHVSFSQNVSSNDSIQIEKQKAIDLFQKIDDLKQYVDQLNLNQLNTLPIGVKKTIANTDCILAVSKITYHDTYAELDLYAKVNMVQGGGKTLFFGAKGIKMSYEGQIVGTDTLTLLGNIDITIDKNGTKLVLKGGFDSKTGKSENLTSVAVSCKGIEEFKITADLVFPTSLLRKVDSNRQVTTDTVKASFSVTAQNLNDIVAEVTLPDFAIVGLPDFIFSCRQLVFDFSEIRNSSDIVFPVGYEQKHLVPGNENLWKGVYAKQIQVFLPPQFKNKDQTSPNERVSFMATNLLIDENGVSGIFSSNMPILSYDNGTASGWKFSVDNFMLALDANKITQAGFGGYVGLPTGSNAKLSYNAHFDNKNNYTLTVKTIDNLSFDVLKAKATIDKNSYVTLKLVNGQFEPEAMLNGSLCIQIQSDKSTGGNNDKVNFNGIKFQSLHIQTKTPYVTASYFGYTGDVKVLNFPVNISNIALICMQNDLGLSVGFNLQLSDFIKSVGGTLMIKGDLTPSKGIQSWKYKGFGIGGFNLNASFDNVMTLTGQLKMLEDDPVYGNAISGSLSMSFQEGLDGLTVNANTMFGKIGYSYWFVDAKVGLPPPGIQIGMFKITGFSGGASYQMKKIGANQTNISLSGCSYTPNNSYGLGVKAGVLFSVAQEDLVNAEASFEILFNKSGGLNFLGFYGDAKFLGKIPGTDDAAQYTSNALKTSVEKENQVSPDVLQNEKLNKPQDAAATTYASSSLKNGDSGLTATTAIEYDFTNNSFLTNFDLYANIAGGVIRGSNSGNEAGSGIIYISKNDWYAYMGTPDKRISLTVGIENLFNVNTTSYFMTGKNIPASPPPPAEVANILGTDVNQLNYMRDLNAIGSGTGVAFGSSLGFDTGDLSAGIVYARFQAGLGFDIMLKDYGNTKCQGSNSPLGVEGWYANGQAYAYLQGELGVRMWGNHPIIQGSAAALFQTALPNPSWFSGTLHGNYKIGHRWFSIKGSVDFNMTFGRQCNL